MTAVDATDTQVPVVGPGARIVSLVPSVSELLHRLGVADRVVGVTTFCVAPADGFPRARRVRGTKNPDVDAIAELAPDVVFANLEENRERDVTALRQAGLQVHVSYPRDVDGARATVTEIAGIVGAGEAVSLIVDDLDAARAGAAARRPTDPVSTFCAIWRDPWMAIGPTTYAGALLGECGLSVWPDTGETYPQVDLHVALEAAQVVLMPDEPYPFTAVDAQELRNKGAEVRHADGAALTWHGSRTATGLRLFSALAEDLAEAGRRPDAGPRQLP